MAYQLIYTSIRSGLIAGRSGFCTAARHREIKESLVARLEDFASSYDRGILDREGALPILYSYRIADIRDNRYHVLMRLGDAGNDYSGRTNHLAHFLVIEPTELTGVSITPAEAILALQARGFWKSRYEDSAAYLGENEVIHLSTLSPSVNLPAAAWADWSGDPGNAAHLFNSEGPQKTAFPTAGDSEESAGQLLRLFAEGALLSSPDRNDPQSLWSAPFTTLLQSNSERRTFPWAGIPAGTPLVEKEAAAGSRVFSAGQAAAPPAGNLAALASGREIEPVYSTVPIPPAESLANSPQIAQAAVSGQAGPATLPTADLSGSAEAPAPESSIPISLSPRETERRKAGRGFTKTTLVSAAVLCVLVMVATTIFHFLTEKRRDLEEEIEGLVDKKKWSEVDERLWIPSEEEKDLVANSKKLKQWQVQAHAIDRFIKIEDTPHDFNGVVPGKDNATEAIETIIQETPEALRSEEFNKYKAEAEAAVAAWEKSITERNEIMAAVWKRFRDIATHKSGPAPKAITSNELEDLRSQIYERYGATDSVNQTLDAELKTLKEALPYLEELSKFAEFYGTEKELQAAKQKQEGKASKLKLLTDKSPKNAKGSIKVLYQQYESLKLNLQLPQIEKSNAKPENGPTNHPDETISPEPAEDWTIYLVPLGEDNKLDLTTIEKGNALPKTFRIASADPAEEPFRVTGDGKYYDGGDLVFTAKERILEVESDYSHLFTSQTRLLPASTPPSFEVVVMPSEESPDSPPLFAKMPISECVFSEGSTLRIAETAKKQLERFEPLERIKRDSGNWRITISLNDETAVLKEGAISDLWSNPAETAANNLELFKSRKVHLEESKFITEEFDNTFRRLDVLLLPDFEKPKILNPPLGEKEPYKIIYPDTTLTPAADKSQDSNRLNTRVSASSYIDFIKKQIATLSELADGCEGHNKANPDIQKTIEATPSETPSIIENWVGLWIELANQSRINKWSTPPLQPESTFPKKENAIDALEKYIAALHFAKFFERWEMVFLDQDKVENLVKYFSLQPAYRSGKQIDDDIRKCESQLALLQSNEVLKHLQASFHFIWEVEGSTKSVLVIQSKPDDAN